MKKKTKYTNEPIKFKVIEDFLPSPEELGLKQSIVKVTINLNESSVRSFKELAAKQHTQYQKLIRSVIDEYAQKKLSS